MIPGEDILSNGNGSKPSIISDGFDKKRVWVFNEMNKDQWSFNTSYYVFDEFDFRPQTPKEAEEADNLTKMELVIQPFFKRFDNGDGDFPTWDDGEWLYGTSARANDHLPEFPFDLEEGSINSLKNHAKVLAEGIPAHSFAAGANEISSLGMNGNIDINVDLRNGQLWPASRDTMDWLHSDYLVSLNWI